MADRHRGLPVIRTLARSVPLLWVLLAVFAILTVWGWFRPDTAPLVPPAVEQRQDSIEETEPEHRQTVDSLKMLAAEATTRQRRAEARARVEEARADSAQGRAATLEAEARTATTARDSARLAFEALAERNGEIAGLRRALVEKDDALAEAECRAAAGERRADEEAGRRAVLEQQNRDLAAALDKAKGRGRFLGIELPSRTTSFLLGTAAGGLLVTGVQAAIPGEG